MLTWKHAGRIGLFKERVFISKIANNHTKRKYVDKYQSCLNAVVYTVMTMH